MKWIETLGPPSIGKSHLLMRLNHVARKNDISSGWINEKEWIESVANNLNFKDCNTFFQKVLLFYINQNFLSYKKTGCQNVLVNKTRFKSTNIEESIWAFYLENHLQGVYESNYPPFQKLFFIEGYNRLLQKLHLFSGGSSEKVIYIDEGPIHNNFGFNLGFRTFDQETKPALILHYIESVELIYGRIAKKETEKGKKCAWYKGYQDESLRKKIGEIISFTNKKITLLKENKIPVLEITSADMTDENKIIELLDKINVILSKNSTGTIQ